MYLSTKYKYCTPTLAVIHYPLFLYKNEFFSIIFLQNILQNAPNCTIFKNFLGEHAPEPPLTNAWFCHALHDAKRHANTPTFGKNILNPTEMKS